MRVPTLIDKAFLLKKTPLFESLDLDLLLAIADKCAPFEIEEGDDIFAKGQEGSLMYFIITGEVIVQDGLSEAVCLGAHDFFGDESVFSEKPRAYTAKCTTETRLLTLSRTHLHTIISECPTVATALLHAYASTQPYRHHRTRSGEGA